VTPLELTAAYVPFANGGYRPDVHFVKRITTTGGEVLYEFTGGNNPRVVRSDVVGMMNSMMTGTVETGTATKAAFAWPAAGKTGTSQKSRDAWFIGYTANLTTGVWFGNDDGAPMKKVTGGALPAQAWHEFMVAAHEGVPVAPLPGNWHSRGADEMAARPDAPVQQAPVGAVSASQRVESTGYETPSMEEEPTSSIRRIVPPGDVGAPAPKRTNSILDILTGG
jgi:penicillin-binding protein 1A